MIVIRKDGKALVSRINEKVFMGKDILHVGIWKKGDERMVYNLIYSDGKGGIAVLGHHGDVLSSSDRKSAVHDLGLQNEVLLLLLTNKAVAVSSSARHCDKIQMCL